MVIEFLIHTYIHSHMYSLKVEREILQLSLLYFLTLKICPKKERKKERVKGKKHIKDLSKVSPAAVFSDVGFSCVDISWGPLLLKP